MPKEKDIALFLQKSEQRMLKREWKEVKEALIYLIWNELEGILKNKDSNLLFTHPCVFQNLYGAFFHLCKTKVEVFE